jgi:hypothetical protein
MEVLRLEFSYGIKKREDFPFSNVDRLTSKTVLLESQSFNDTPKLDLESIKHKILDFKLPNTMDTTL